MKTTQPAAIEDESFRIIRTTLQEMGLYEQLDQDTLPVVMRAIHATADFDFAKNLVFSARVIPYAVHLLHEHPVIVTDTQMALSGINKQALGRLGMDAVCYMADPAVASEAKRRNLTRAWVSMEKAAREYQDQKKIFVIGNAPTALMSLYEMFQAGILRPELLIGVPVGFVNVVESKEIFLNTDLSYIIARGRKGGSTVAASVMNALLYLASPRTN